MSSESKFEIDLRAKTSALNLRVRLKGALWASPVGKAHQVSGSIRARFRTCILRVSVTLLQVLGASNGNEPLNGNGQQAPEVRYSLRIRLRKLWLRIRGKHQGSRPQGALQVVKAAESPTPLIKKTKLWRRSFSSVGRQMLRRNRTSEKITTAYLQKPVKENGYVAQYMDALGTDRVVRVLHGVGMVSTLIVLVQLAGTRGLSLFVTFVTGLAIVGRLVFVNRYAFLGPGVQQVWHEAISVGGISLVPQVLRAIFRPYLPQFGITISESVMGTFTLILILLARYKRLPFKVMRFFGIVSAGIPAILILWAPIVQLWTCCWSPANVNFMQIFTGLLAVLSNCLPGYPHSSLNQHQTLQSLHKL